MPKHKSEDYKLSAVQYYLENNAGFGCPGNIPPINPDTHFVNNKKNYMC